MPMDVKIINPFLAATVKLLKDAAGIEAKKEAVNLQQKDRLKYDVGVIIGIVGAFEGSIIFGMSKELGIHLASSMMGGFQLDDFNEMAQSAISELGNMISGNAAASLEAENIVIDITPPSLVVGREVEIKSFNASIVTITFNIDGMKFDVNISSTK
jgi:chemotaxis protein CheX